MQGTNQGAMESQGHGKTAAGKLPPSEVNKALAFEAVISAMEKHMGKSCWELDLFSPPMTQGVVGMLVGLTQLDYYVSSVAANLAAF